MPHVINKKPKLKAPVEAEPVAVEQRSPIWRDPGTRISEDRVDALIECIFNDGPRVIVSEAA